VPTTAWLLVGPAVTATAIAVLVLLVVVGNTDMAIVVAAAAVLVGMFFLRRYARARLVYDNEPGAGREASVPAGSEKRNGSRPRPPSLR
jgi:membrane protein implicated in regulation of membrane protease activity